MNENTEPINPIELDRNSLGSYAMTFFKGIQFSWHHNLIIKALMKVEAGECKRLLITAPPRHSKSLLVSEFFPPWCMGRKPERQIITSTYGQSLSLEFGRKVKDQMTSDAFREIFPECQVKHDSKAAERISTTMRGVYHATSIGGPTTGKGADIFIVDDPVKDRQEAESETIRENIWNWYLSVARTRLQPGGAIIVMQTRWHEDDLTGRILAADQGKNQWEHIHLRALDDEERPLWPGWMNAQALLEIKEDLGSYEWNALYQGDPAPKEGNILKVDQIRKYKELPKFDRLIQVVDSAIKEKKENDYTVISTLGVHDNRIYLVDMWRDKVAYPKLKKAIREKYQEFYPTKILIEDKASGQQLIQELSEDLPIKAIPGIDDPILRVGILSDYIELGRLYLPENEAYTEDIINELRSFPNGTHDDIVMTLAYGSQELRISKIISYYKSSWNQDAHTFEFLGNPPRHWPIFRTLSWSPTFPFCALWWVVTADDEEWCKRWWPNNSIAVFREWYGGEGDKGLNLSTEQVAQSMLRKEKKWSFGLVRPGPAGSERKSNLWSKEKGPSLYDKFAKQGVYFLPAYNDRIAGLAHLNSRLIGENGMPSIYFSLECKRCIEDIPSISKNLKNEEDITLDQHHFSVSAIVYLCNYYQLKARPKPKEARIPEVFLPGQPKKVVTGNLDNGFGY